MHADVSVAFKIAGIQLMTDVGPAGFFPIVNNIPILL